MSRLLVAIPFPFFPRLGDEVFEFCCSEPHALSVGPFGSGSEQVGLRKAARLHCRLRTARAAACAGKSVPSCTWPPTSAVSSSHSPHGSSLQIRNSAPTTEQINPRPTASHAGQPQASTQSLPRVAATKGSARRETTRQARNDFRTFIADLCVLGRLHATRNKAGLARATPPCC